VKTTHLDYETLADLAEGLLDDERAASANEHLVDCAECLDRSAELADVSQLLANAPLPPLPVELAERIDDAIAAEAAGSSAAVGTPSRQRWNLRLLSAAAAAVVAVGGGAVVGSQLLRSSTPPDYTKSQAARDPVAHAPASAVSPSDSAGLTAGRRRITGPDGYRLIASGVDYKAAMLGGQVAAVLRSGEGGTAVSAIRLKNCIAQIAQGADPVLVDQARYNGRHATLIVLRGSDPHDPHELDVWVVGPKCAATTPDVIRHIHMAG
jgi:hypothetical protein